MIRPRSAAQPIFPDAYGIDIRQTVDRRDASVIEGRVDHGREDIHGADHRQRVRQLGGAEFRRSTRTGGELGESDVHEAPNGNGTGADLKRSARQKATVQLAPARGMDICAHLRYESLVDSFD